MVFFSEDKFDICNVKIRRFPSERGKADIQEDLDYRLKEAACDGNMKEIKELLEDGASYKSQLSVAGTAIHFAANSGNYKIVKYFLEEKNFPINSTSLLGNTLAHEAAYSGHIDVISLLAEFGADLKRENKYGETPYVVAKRRKFTSCAKFIKKLLKEDNIPEKVYDKELQSHFEGKKKKEILWNRKLKPWEGYAFQKQIEDGQIGRNGEKKLQLKYFAKALTESYLQDAIKIVEYKRKGEEIKKKHDSFLAYRSEYRPNNDVSKMKRERHNMNERPSLTEKIRRINLKRKEEMKTGSG